LKVWSRILVFFIYHMNVISVTILFVLVRLIIFITIFKKLEKIKQLLIIPIILK